MKWLGFDEHGLWRTILGPERKNWFKSRIELWVLEDDGLSPNEKVPSHGQLIRRTRIRASDKVVEEVND